MPKQKTDNSKVQATTRAAAPKRQSSTAQPPTFNARIEGIDYGILDELTGYAVRRAQLSIYADFSASLGVYDITPSAFHLW
ncbi:hypothetical protein UNDYM_5865 [Undibacterium sp. YM2]|uniref:hypothetical protein n=1 Tax=Undibacterium sp. YM2 TaxID=2058625 RepID=UPI001331F1BA|nr:hypothetical protein [Undibacterium sp. YM2]BBB70118.1 hypothetical protein UNDYM_5865 [Undibacterium sp. YM2]